MATLKELRLRIRSVSSTQKITRAMKVVAASKLRKAREKAESARPYAERMDRMLRSLRSSLGDSSNASPLMVGSGRNKTHLLIVITSDRGLCGALNGHLIRAVRNTVRDLHAEGKEVKIFAYGKKGYELLRKQYKDDVIKRSEWERDLGYEDAKDIADELIGWFEDGTYDVATIFYNHFKSAISQTVTMQQIIPLPAEPITENDTPVTGDFAAPYDYEPDEQTIINELLPRNLTVQIFHALLENMASEQGARMSAMDNATRNAGDMINRLTLSYNRTRQAAITTELTEIISGAESL